MPWYRRGFTALAPTSHWPLCGFQISASRLTLVGWFQTLLPPVASTLPSARIVATERRRWRSIALVVVIDGVAPLMSITMAWLELPPYCRMRPGANIAALESLPAVADANWPAVVMAPLPAVFT